MELQSASDFKSTLELNPPQIIQYLKNKNSPFLSNIFTVAKIIEPILNKISEIFPEYTLHDINHSIRILDYIFDLIEEKIENISNLDLAIIIYSALLHDIGMYANTKDIKEIKELKKDNSNEVFSSILKKYGDEKIALQDYIRRNHANRSKMFITSNEIQNYMVIPEMPTISFSKDVADICLSHTESFNWIEKKLKKQNKKGNYDFNPQFISMLLRIGDILDIDSNRTPLTLFNLINPEGISKGEWEQHYSIYNRQKIGKNNYQFEITLYGECQNPDVHRKLLKYVEWINEEIKNFNNLTSSMEEKYKINIKYPLINKIEPIGYKISDMTLKTDYRAISNLLMGENIYGDKKLGLRELIQNSIDTCKVRYELEKIGRKSWEEKYQPVIQIILAKEDNQVIIKDNGVGMSLSIIQNYFLNIGVSYYKSDDYLFQGLDYKSIGNFGIGFLSCFMLSDDVIVKTKHIKDAYKYELNLNKESQYICLNEVLDSQFQGTEIILNYNSFMTVFKNEFKQLSEFVSKHFLTDNINIKIIDTNDLENSLVIKNEFFVESSKSKKDHVINLEKYCKNISGFIEISNLNNFFKTSFKEWNNFDDVLVYSNKKLISSENSNHKFIDFFLENKFQLIKVSIVDEDKIDRFEKHYLAIENYYEVFDRIGSELTSIYIFIENSVEHSLYDRDIIEPSQFLFEDINVKALEPFGHDVSFPIQVFIEDKYAILEEVKNTVLLYNEIENYSHYSYYNTHYIFLRNVLVNQFSFTRFPMLYGLNIKSIKMNILDERIFPTVSRTALEKISESEISYLVCKVIIFYIKEISNFSPVERELFENFIDLHYSRKSKLLISDI